MHLLARICKFIYLKLVYRSSPSPALQLFHHLQVKVIICLEMRSQVLQTLHTRDLKKKKKKKVILSSL